MDTEEVVHKKPPLGLVPRFIIVEKRTAEILEAMQRYVAEGYKVPEEWRDELEELLNEPHWKTIEGVEDANKKKRR